MIFYFTGTGNSKWVANQLSDLLNESVINISELLNTHEKEWMCSLEKDERLLFVYPIHSWGVPLPVIHFISGLKVMGYNGQSVYSVCTCGDDCGLAVDVLRKALQKQGIPLTAGFSVQMPNNYILLPGFDVDPKDLEQEKLRNAVSKVENIAEVILRKGESTSLLYHKGSCAFLKTRMIYPLFINFALGKNSFYATDNCISCGLCEKVCPTKTISISEGRPVWQDTCVQCLACIHRCPVRAIEYGKSTLKKGRYHHPDVNR